MFFANGHPRFFGRWQHDQQDQKQHQQTQQEGRSDYVMPPVNFEGSVPSYAQNPCMIFGKLEANTPYHFLKSIDVLKAHICLNMKGVPLHSEIIA